MARIRSRLEPIEPEDRSQEVEVEEAEPDDPEAPAVSKAEAVRQALAAGAESPGDGVEFIREEFGIEITKPHFSATKSVLKKRGGAAPSKPGRKPKSGRPASRGVEGYLAPPPKQGGTPGADILGAMESLKPLIAELGAERVKRIVDLLG